MNLHTQALADIKLALGEGLPPKYKGEAFWKMGICHKARGETEKARVCFELAEKLLEDKEELKRDSQNVERIKQGVDDKKGGWDLGKISSVNWWFYSSAKGDRRNA